MQHVEARATDLFHLLGLRAWAQAVHPLWSRASIIALARSSRREISACAPSSRQLCTGATVPLLRALDCVVEGSFLRIVHCVHIYLQANVAALHGSAGYAGVKASPLPKR